MRRFLISLFLFIVGCGYTTRGFVYEESGIYIKPVANKISVAQEKRVYSSYVTYPILLEKKLTNTLVNKFNIDGNLSVSSDKYGVLQLECEIRDYRKEALRYSSADDVTEQRLRLYVHTILYGKKGNVIKEKDIVGEASYFLSGTLAKSETAAQDDLIDDTARRVVEAVVENW